MALATAAPRRAGGPTQSGCPASPGRAHAPQSEAVRRLGALGRSGALARSDQERRRVSPPTRCRQPAAAPSALGTARPLWGPAAAAPDRKYLQRPPIVRIQPWPAPQHGPLNQAESAALTHGVPRLLLPGRRRPQVARSRAPPSPPPGRDPGGLV